jgi:hypothetical protein
MVAGKHQGLLLACELSLSSAVVESKTSNVLPGQWPMRLDYRLNYRLGYRSDFCWDYIGDCCLDYRLGFRLDYRLDYRLVCHSDYCWNYRDLGHMPFLA